MVIIKSASLADVMISCSVLQLLRQNSTSIPLRHFSRWLKSVTSSKIIATLKLIKRLRNQQPFSSSVLRFWEMFVICICSKRRMSVNSSVPMSAKYRFQGSLSLLDLLYSPGVVLQYFFPTFTVGCEYQENIFLSR